MPGLFWSIKSDLRVNGGFDVFFVPNDQVNLVSILRHFHFAWKFHHSASNAAHVRHRN